MPCLTLSPHFDSLCIDKHHLSSIATTALPVCLCMRTIWRMNICIWEIFFWRNVESLRQIFALHNMIHTLCATMKTVAHSAHALHFHRIRFFSFSVQVYNVVCFRVCYTLRTKVIINNVCVCVSMPGLLNIVFVWVETELSVLIYRLALFNQFSIQTQINGRRKS